MNTDNKMRELKVEKVTANIGVGTAGDELDNAKSLLETLTKARAVLTAAKKRNPVFKLRVGLTIGVKATLRGKDADAFLKNALTANKKVLKASSIDSEGNISFGVREYIDFPGAKYDPAIGMLGFDVCVTIARKGGKRVKTRRRKTSKVGRPHRIAKEETIKFMQDNYGVKFE